MSKRELLFSYTRGGGTQWHTDTDIFDLLVVPEVLVEHLGKRHQRHVSEHPDEGIKFHLRTEKRRTTRNSRLEDYPEPVTQKDPEFPAIFTHQYRVLVEA